MENSARGGRSRAGEPLEERGFYTPSRVSLLVFLLLKILSPSTHPIAKQTNPYGIERNNANTVAARYPTSKSLIFTHFPPFLFHNDSMDSLLNLQLLYQDVYSYRI